MIFHNASLCTFQFQEAVEKAIVAEQRLRVRVVSPPPVLSPPLVELSDDKVVESLVTRLRHQFPSATMEDFAADVMRKCAAPGSYSGELTSLRGG